MKKTIFCLLAIGSFFCSCKSGEETEITKTQVQVLELKDTTCRISYSYPATLKGFKDVAIYPQVSGRITEAKVKEGQFVKAGDVLFVIDDTKYKAAYDAAKAQVEVCKAQLETSRLTLQSKQNLFDKDIISEYQLNLAKNAVATSKATLGQAEAALKAAANDLSFTRVRNLTAGYVGSLPYTTGSLVGPDIQKPLTTVSDNSIVYAAFSITENEYLELGINPDSQKADDNRGITINLITNLGERYPLPGTIHSVSGMISAETGSITVKAKFPNPDKKLLSGGSGKVEFSLDQDGLIVIPRSAMKEIQDKMFVFVVKEGKLVQTEVKAVRLNSKQWCLIPDGNGEITLKTGDRITRTTNRLLDGMDVEIIK